MTEATDVTLVARAQRGDRSATEELVRRHRRRAENVSLSFFLPGAERDDLRQEAVIGLLSAIRDFRPESGTSFVSFMHVCVHRWLATVVRESFRDKRRTLSESQRLAYEEETGEAVAITDLLPDPRADVPRFAEARAELRRILDETAAMPYLERVSLIGIALGYSYIEIERCVDEHFDSVRQFRKPLTFKGADNAIQRARHKLRRAA